MQAKLLLTAVCFSLALCGCSRGPHVIGYDVLKSATLPPNLGTLHIATLKDERPKQEKEGVKGKLLSFSSKNSHFTKEAPVAIEEILSEELHNAGFTLQDKKEDALYTISGSVKHFQAIMSSSKIAFLPYLGTIATLWEKDNFTIALSVYIKMTDNRNTTLIDKTFDVSEEMKLPTGLLSLARYSQGINYKLKLLDEALKNVMEQIRNETIAKVK